MKRKLLVCACSAVLALFCMADPSVSEPTPIMVDVDSFYIWRTATGGTMRVEWTFPLDATVAHLVVTGRTVKISIPDITDEFADVELPVPANAKDEDVIDFTLSFNDGTVKTASLGLVRGRGEGAGITTSTECLASKDSPFWRYAEKRFVVPVPHGTKSVTRSVIDAPVFNAKYAIAQTAEDDMVEYAAENKFRRAILRSQNGY